MNELQGKKKRAVNHPDPTLLLTCGFAFLDAQKVRFLTIFLEKITHIITEYKHKMWREKERAVKLLDFV